MIKVDLHTHSSASPDGGLTLDDYKIALDNGLLDYIAVTDHNSADFALELNKIIGNQIIVGEEIMTTEGEIIGLFLKRTIDAGLSPKETAQAIHEQGGLVYIPHPLETVRKGLSKVSLDRLAEHIDIVEVYNARAAFQNRGPQAATWARIANKAVSASSDAHGRRGLGTSYTTIEKRPTPQNLVTQLAQGSLQTGRASFASLLYPKYHRFRKKIRKT